LTFVPVRDSRTRRTIVEVNFLAYGETPPAGLHGLDDARVWNEASYGVVGFAGSEPVTSSAVFLLDDCFYVGWVATVPDHKRKGFADAAMRESLAAAARDHGWKRSVLHASKAGRGLYERMGYQAVAEHALYLPSD
jgi:GNAT superfamily N-acetyltransferase